MKGILWRFPLKQRQKIASAFFVCVASNSDCANTLLHLCSWYNWIYTVTSYSRTIICCCPTIVLIPFWVFEYKTVQCCQRTGVLFLNEVDFTRQRHNGPYKPLWKIFYDLFISWRMGKNFCVLLVYIFTQFFVNGIKKNMKLSFETKSAHVSLG